MYTLLNTIAPRCHAAAARRGKDTSCVGCIKQLHSELNEYWRAVDDYRLVQNIEALTEQAEKLYGAEFAKYYHENIHNTTIDELADILITAATWLHAARLADDESFQPSRVIDVMLAKGAVRFIHEQLTFDDMANLLDVVELKMRYNETRED